MVLKPGARQDCAINPNLSSAKQITSSPLFQSQLGMFSKYAYKYLTIFEIQMTKISVNIINKRFSSKHCTITSLDLGHETL